MSAAKDSEYDVVVVGAGINGAGIARDAAMRGLRTLLLEKSDVCSGTSWISSRLIHGGLRYLEYGEIPLVYESLHERRYLRVNAAHLVKPIRITIPIYEGARRAPWLIRLGMLAYDLLSLGKSMPRHQMLNRDGMIELAPGLEREGLRAGARYYDAQVTYAERLVLENLLAARSAGATISTYKRVYGFDLVDNEVRAVRFEDALTGERGEASAATVVNATGPWVDTVLNAADEDAARLIGGTKGSHIIVSAFEGAPSEAFYVEAKSDGRPFFIIPWNGLYLIGTTDIRYDGSLDECRASRDEIDYLLAETNRVFVHAAIGIDDIHYAYAGVRPLPYQDKGPESAITRKHIIKVNSDIASNMVSIVGGKLTTYRHLAEEAVDRVGKILKRRLPACRTHDTRLPGGWGFDEVMLELEPVAALSAAGKRRLVDIYGGQAIHIAKLATGNAALATPIDELGLVLPAEIVYVVRNELVRTLGDVVFRRTMLGLSADQARPLYNAIGEIVAAELDWDAATLASEIDELVGYSDSLLPPGK